MPLRHPFDKANGHRKHAGKQAKAAGIAQSAGLKFSSNA
jgi:hypothetical protein